VNIDGLAALFRTAPIVAIILAALMIATSVGGQSMLAKLAEISEWVSAEGFAGQLDGAPVRALGYDVSQSIKQRAFQGSGTTHLFYVTSSGSIVLGYVDKMVTILWRIEGMELKATAHGDMMTRKIWQVQNSEHSELFVEEVAYWIERWTKHVQQNPK
jgi:hypothetical protein